MNARELAIFPAAFSLDDTCMYVRYRFLNSFQTPFPPMYLPRTTFYMTFLVKVALYAVQQNIYLFILRAGATINPQCMIWNAWGSFGIIFYFFYFFVHAVTQKKAYCINENNGTANSTDIVRKKSLKQFFKTIIACRPIVMHICNGRTAHSSG